LLLELIKFKISAFASQVKGMLTLQQFGKVNLKAADREFNERKVLAA